MELHEAIKNVIETDGIEIIKDPRLVNILSDLQAFETTPACKYILRSVIADGYAQKLLTIGSWNTQCENLCNQFVTKTGFQRDYVFLVFQSLACGLGYLTTIGNVSGPVSQNPTRPPRPQANKLNLRYFELNKLPEEEQYRYKEAAEDYLNSITEVKGDWKKEFGVGVQASTIFEYYTNAFKVYVALEINGSFPRKYKSIAIEVALYNTNGRVLSTTCGIWSKRNRTFDIVTCDPFSDNSFETVGNIGRVVVSWGDCYDF